MARHLRVEFPGAIYHVTCRMIGESVPRAGLDGAVWAPECCLFRDDADRVRFLDRLAERVEQYNVRLYLFVLMTNHTHLVFETPEANCSRFMHSLSPAYSVYYNLRHGRHGHLLDGRFKGKLVEGDAYLLALSRYVHLNPVCVGTMKNEPLRRRIRHLRRYSWSSYPSYVGQRKALEFVDYGPMLAQMGGKEEERKRRYRGFVESGLADSDEEFKEALQASPRSIGSDGFRVWVDKQYQKLVAGHRRPDDVSFRRMTEPLSSQIVLDVLCDVLAVEVDAFRQRRRNSLLRAVAAHCLCRYGGLTQRDAASILNVGSGAAISHQLRKLAAELPKDRKLRRLVKTAEDRLKTLRDESLTFNSRADP